MTHLSVVFFAIMLFFLLIIIAVAIGIVVIIRKSRLDKGDKEEADLNLKRRIERLEKELENIKNK